MDELGRFRGYSVKRLEAACAKTLSYTVHPSLKNVQAILKSGQDKLLDSKDASETPQRHPSMVLHVVLITIKGGITDVKR